MSWKQLTEPLRYYAYSYDNLSRLTNANYGEDNNATNRFTTSYSYDKHGNMKTLTRRGNTDGSATNGMVDNLTMTYTGNQLAKASDTGVSVPMSSSMDFKDYSNVATEYTYNANGAMNKDLNKGISDIQYNSLNLPRMMDIKSPVAEARNEYTYSASGQKLKVVQKWNPNFSTAPVIGSGINTASLTQARTTDYTGNIIYENNALKRILVDGGYYEGGVYYYYLADHLGNNHVVVKSDGTSIQSNSYYPFGMHYAPGIGYEKQPYKYNNKELDQMHGLNIYDNLARLYDPVVPHTPTPDPHAENYYSWSPYAWVGNNPMRNIDPFGTDVWTTNDPDQIARFLNHLQAVSGNKTSNPFDYGGWNRMTDDEYKEHNKDESVSFNDDTFNFNINLEGYQGNFKAGMRSKETNYAYITSSDLGGLFAPEGEPDLPYGNIVAGYINYTVAEKYAGIVLKNSAYAKSIWSASRHVGGTTFYTSRFSLELHRLGLGKFATRNWLPGFGAKTYAGQLSRLGAGLGYVGAGLALYQSWTIGRKLGYWYGGDAVVRGEIGPLWLRNIFSPTIPAPIVKPPRK